MDKRLRLECLNKEIGKRDYLQWLFKNIKKELEEAEESVRIWSKETKEQ